MTTHWIWPPAQLLAAAARGPRRLRSSSGGADGVRRGAPSQQAAPRPGGGGAGRVGAWSGGQVRGTPSPPPPSPSSSSGHRGHERFREIFLGSRLSAGLDFVFVEGRQAVNFSFLFPILSVVYRRRFSPEKNAR